MKIFKVLVVIFIIASSSCAEEVKTSYTINGDAKGMYNGIRVYLNEVGERGRMVAIDTAIVMNESFLFEGSVDEPRLNYITVQSVPGRLPFMIENSDISIVIDKAVVANSTVTGSKSDLELNEYMDNAKIILTELRELNEKRGDAKFYNDQDLQKSLQLDIEKVKLRYNEYPFEFINTHKTSYASFQALETLLGNKDVDFDRLENSFNSLSQELQTSDQGSSYKTKLDQYKIRLAQAKATDIGAKAPGFSAATPSGENLALSEVYSKGKITIVDFWAAWCGPCRRENPNIVSIYNDYHSKGLEILGVSLDGRRGQQNPKDAWLKAIEDDGLTWNHVSNLDYFGPITKQYNVTAIPAMFIVDTDGKIIAKNLRGQALRNKVAELLAP